jgi:Dcp1-like decapping family
MPRYPPQGSIQAQPEHQPLSHPLPQVSDYDSDTPGYGSDFPTKPPPRDRTVQELNISVLERHNPEIVSILHITPYAAIYEFVPLPDKQWSKINIEGALFISQLTPGAYGEDRFNATVLNRKGLDNFTAPLLESENGGVEVSDGFVIVTFMQEHEPKVYGIWIHGEEESASQEHAREKTADLMIKVALAAGHSRKAAENAASEAQERHKNGHVQEAIESLEEQGMGASLGRQISLQQLFGQQRAEGASFSARSHNMDGAADIRPQHAYSNAPPHMAAPKQSDVLGDLFRQAGIGMQ